MNLKALFFGARHPTATRPPTASIGMYTGVPLPQDPRSAMVSQFLPTLANSGGLRESLSTNRSGKYFGTDGLPPLRFPLSGPPHVNQPINFQAAALKDN